MDSSSWWMMHLLLTACKIAGKEQRLTSIHQDGNAFMTVIVPVGGPGTSIQPA